MDTAEEYVGTLDVNNPEFSEWVENGCAKAAEIILQSESNEKNKYMKRSGC